MPTLRVEVTQAQFKRLEEQAEEKGFEDAPEEALVAIWWGRTQALDKYAERRKQPGAKFRPYVPLKLKERDEVKASAVRQGIAPVAVAKALKAAPKKVKAPKKAKEPKKVAPPKLVVAPKLKKAKPPKKKAIKIDLYDSAEVAVNKAKLVAEAGGPPVAETLKAAERTETGELSKGVAEVKAKE